MRTGRWSGRRFVESIHLQVRVPVELGQRVEELTGLRVRLQRRRDVVGQVSALGSFRLDADLHDIARSEPTIPAPHAGPSTKPRWSPTCLDRSTDTHSCDGAVDQVPRLGSPLAVGIERDRDVTSTTIGPGDDNRLVVPWIRHRQPR